VTDKSAAADAAALGEIHVGRTTSGGRRKAVRPLDTSATNAQITQRIEAIERLVVAQREQIEQQEQELAQLRATMTATPSVAPDVAPDAPLAAAPQVAPAQTRKQPLSTSRRALLMVGGAATAAAAIEAVALTHGGSSAQAHGAKAATGGVAWQTGTVSADTETLVKPSSASYPSNDILQVQLGTGAVYSPAPLKSAITAYDTTTNGYIGVYATSSTGYGLYGVTNSGNGATGAGLSGVANSGTGVAGNSNAGIGVSGTSVSGLGAMFTGGQAPIALGTAGAAGAPTAGNHVAGEVYADSNADLWVCASSGTPGTWQKLTHLVPGYTSGGAITFLSKPVRLLDTRAGYNDSSQNNNHQPCTSASPTTVHVASVTYGGVAVPAGALGAIGNVTVLSNSGGGYLSLVPSGTGFSGTSNVNFAGAEIIANSFTVGLGGGAIDIYVGGTSIDVLVDLFAVIA